MIIFVGVNDVGEFSGSKDVGINVGDIAVGWLLVIVVGDVVGVLNLFRLSLGRF